MRAGTQSTDTYCVLATTLVRDARADDPTAPTVTDVPRSATETEFGAYLRRLMAENGFNRPADLARAAKMPASSLSRWSDGTYTPTIDALRAVAPFLGVRLGDLMIKAGLATAAELGTVGAPPPPRAPLPPQLQRVVSILLNPKVSDNAKRVLLSAIDRTIELWEEMREPPREPRMRKRT